MQLFYPDVPYRKSRDIVRVNGHTACCYDQVRTVVYEFLYPGLYLSGIVRGKIQARDLTAHGFYLLSYDRLKCVLYLSVKDLVAGYHNTCPGFPDIFYAQNIARIFGYSYSLFHNGSLYHERDRPCPGQELPFFNNSVVVYGCARYLTEHIESEEGLPVDLQ